MILESFSRGVKRKRYEADNSPPSGAEFTVELYLHSFIRLRGVVLEHTNGLLFYLGDTSNNEFRQEGIRNILKSVPCVQRDIQYDDTGSHRLLIVKYSDFRVTMQ